MARMSVRQRVVFWLGASSVGAGILALPDSGPRLFSFSETHGPSAVDAVGMVVLLAAWLPVALLLWTRRASITGRSAWAAGLLAVTGLALLVLTVGLDLGASWMAAVAVLLAAQFVALRSIAWSGTD